MGSTLAELWHRAGHRVFLSSRHPEQLQDVINRLGEGALSGDVRQAASFGEVVALCVPYRELRGIGEELYNELLGKTVIDTSNPLPERDGPIADEAREVGTGHHSHKLLPGCDLVRAFNTLSFEQLAREAHRDGERAGIPVAGETEEAVQTVASLVEHAGFEPVIVGGLKDARFFDPGTPVFNRVMTASELRSALGLPKPGTIDFLR
jgi:predicted dinucleotide-binding enzyme